MAHDDLIRRRAVAGEVATAAAHQAVAEQCDDERVIGVLKRLEQESMDHAKRLAGEDESLRRLLESPEPRGPAESGWDIEVLVSEAGNDPAQAVRAALRSEQGASRFYKAQAPKLSDVALRELFLVIADEEEEHVGALRALIDPTLSKNDAKSAPSKVK